MSIKLFVAIEWMQQAGKSQTSTLLRPLDTQGILESRVVGGRRESLEKMAQAWVPLLRLKVSDDNTP